MAESTIKISPGVVIRLASTNTTELPANSITTIYSEIIPKGTYIMVAKVYCADRTTIGLISGNARMQLVTPNGIGYLTLADIIVSDGVTPTEINLYNGTSTAMTRPYTYDSVRLCRFC